MSRRLLGWTGEVLITVGVLLLLFTVWQLWWTDVVANRASARIVEELRDDFTRQPGAARGGAAPAGPPAGAIALMYVPRLGTDWVRPVLEGTDRDVLTRGVGHYAGTADPGEVGNFAVAGHRTTHGRPFHDIDALREDDHVVVETAESVYVYAVTGSEVVPPTDVAVIAPVPDEPGEPPTDEVLTMTSCHPRYSAAERYVVHASLVRTLPASDLEVALGTAGGVALGPEGVGR
jgi:sortase A